MTNAAEPSVQLGCIVHTATSLHRKRKDQLAALYRQYSDMVWSAVPLERWNKDELVNEILRLGHRPS